MGRFAYRGRSWPYLLLCMLAPIYGIGQTALDPNLQIYGGQIYSAAGLNRNCPRPPSQSRATSASCLAKISMLKAGMEKNESPENILENSLLKNRLVIFGESHMIGSRLLYAKYLTMLKNKIPQFDCLFVESREDNLTMFETDPSAGMVDTLATAKALGLKIIPVDTRNGEGVKIRNSAMVDNIKRNFSDSNCHKGVQIVGANHLASDIASGSIGIPQLLRKVDVPTQAFRLMGTAAVEAVNILALGAPTGQVAFRIVPGFAEGDFAHTFCSPPPALQKPIIFKSDNPQAFDHYLIFPVNGNIAAWK